MKGTCRSTSRGVQKSGLAQERCASPTFCADYLSVLITHPERWHQSTEGEPATFGNIAADMRLVGAVPDSTSAGPTWCIIGRGRHPVECSLSDWRTNSCFRELARACGYGRYSDADLRLADNGVTDVVAGKGMDRQVDFVARGRAGRIEFNTGYDFSYSTRSFWP